MPKHFPVTCSIVSLCLLTSCGQSALPMPPQTNSPTTSPLSISMTNQNITEQEFLANYHSIRAAIQEATPDNFVAHIDTSNTEAEKLSMFKNNWNNQEAKTVWSHFIPDLTKLTRLDFKVDGDWAAYYFEGEAMDASEGFDPENVDINIMRMHRVNNKWLLSLQMGASAIARTQNPEQMKQVISNEIATSDLLSVRPQE